MNNQVTKEFEALEDVRSIHAGWGDWQEPAACSHLDFDVLVAEELDVPGENDWIPTLNQAFAITMATIKEGIKKNVRLNSLESRLRELEDRLAETLSRDSVIIPIMTFAPDPIEVLKEIKAVVQKDEDEFTATFFDANVNASGCNQVDAIDNLKDLILSRFEYLDAQEPQKLGPALVKQIAVLREFIRRR